MSETINVLNLLEVRVRVSEADEQIIRADERAKVEEMLSELPTVNGYIDSAYLWMKWKQLKSTK